MTDDEMNTLIDDYLESHIISWKSANDLPVTTQELDKNGQVNIASVDLITTGSKGDIENFFRRLCSNRTPEQLAYIGAGVVENTAWFGYKPALEALRDAASKSLDVRRAVGFAWFTMESADEEVKRLIDAVESLAVRDLED